MGHGQELTASLAKRPENTPADQQDEVGGEQAEQRQPLPADGAGIAISDRRAKSGTTSPPKATKANTPSAKSGAIFVRMTLSLAHPGGSGRAAAPPSVRCTLDIHRPPDLAVRRREALERVGVGHPSARPSSTT